VKKTRLRLTVAVAAVILVINMTVSIASSSKSIIIGTSGTISIILAGISPLHVKGNLIKDQMNNTVYLRGVNKVEFADDPDGSWMGSALWTDSNVQAELAAMKSWGVNVIRCHLNIEDWKLNTVNVGSEVGNAAIPAQTALVRFAQFAGQQGIYVIYDGYSVRDYFNGQTQDPLPYPPYQTTAGASSVIGSQQDFIDWWTSVANTLKSYSNVIFEPWNEPLGDATAKSSWFTVTQKVINAIRATGAQNLIIAQWDTSASFDLDYGVISDMSWISQANYSDPAGNLVYSTHLYYPNIIRRGTGNIMNFYAYNYVDINLGFQQMGYYSTAQKYPFLIGEIGCDVAFSGNDLVDEYQAFTNQLSLLYQSNISYCSFWWRGMGVYALHNGPPNFVPNQAGTILRNYMP
jgi:hypothetical protein